eukprot:CAMPEP_0113839952 /NCGR_PEP_ID=MMETSP0328-20130328/11360_1 /TAXON_ID=39455 /ORGANISM="Alexandrium minutum" /LENGTH=63 /DNA_ID=CAMNT_0000808613 /DNA_START=143 /DNA_END=330 /DNA_ORIENTATION=- /assembly_acc=CAM_ASM_000350
MDASATSLVDPLGKSPKLYDGLPRSLEALLGSASEGPVALEAVHAVGPPAPLSGLFTVVDAWP